MSAAKQPSRVCATNVIAQATNYTLGTIDAIARELISNSASYCLEGESPTCYLTLLFPEDHRRACFVSRTVSTFSDEDVEHMFDIGHRFGKEMRFAQCFNFGGTTACSAKLSIEDKMDMFAITYDPAKACGRVARGQCTPEGHMMKMGPFRLDLTEDGERATCLKTDAEKKWLDTIKDIWKNTQWGTFGMDVPSDEKFGAFCFDVCVGPAIRANKSMSAFVFTNLKTATCKDSGVTRCFEPFTRSINGREIHDIRLYDNDSEPSLRSCIKNAFCPAIHKFGGMAAEGLDPKDRKIFVQEQEVNVNLTVDPSATHSNAGDDPAGWLLQAAWLLNRSPNLPVMKLMDGRVMLRCCRTQDKPDRFVMKRNWLTTSKSVVTANEYASPSGIIALHGDKKINCLPFDALTGDGVYQVRPDSAGPYSTLVNKLFGESHFTRDDVDSTFTMLGMPDAKLELDTGLEEKVRYERREETRRKLGKGYEEMFEIIVKPVYYKLRTCNVNKLEFSKERVHTCYEDDKRNRSVIAELFGLNTTAVLQLRDLEQPINKETVAHITEKNERNEPKQCCHSLHQEIMRSIVKFNITNPSSALKEHMDGAHEAHARMRADKKKEEEDVEEIKKRRKQHKVAIAAARKSGRGGCSGEGARRRRKGARAQGEEGPGRRGLQAPRGAGRGGREGGRAAGSQKRRRQEAAGTGPRRQGEGGAHRPHQQPRA